MATTNLEVIISARDQFSGTANKVIGSLGRMNSAAGKVGKGVGQVAGGVARLGAVLGTVAATGIGAAAREAFRFEDSMAGVAKTTDLTTDEVKALGMDLREMATTIPIGVNELAGLAEIAGALGISGAENIKEFARVTALLGETTNLSSEEAALALGHIGSVIKLTRDDYERLGATLVDLGNKGASTEDQIAGIAERAAGGAATIGLATQDLLGWSAALANIGVEVEAGGTNLQKFFIESAQNVAANGEELRLMAQTAGVTAAQFRKDFGDNPSSALSQFVNGLGKLETNQRLAILSALGWDDQRMARMLLGLTSNTDNLNDSLETSNTAWEEGNALSVEAQKRFDTTASKLELLKNTVLEAALTFAGDPSDPKTLAGSIGVVAEKLRVALLDPSNKAALESFGRDIGAAISSIDFDALIGTAKTLASTFRNDVVPVLKLAFDAFNALPGPIKGIAASLAILSQTPVIGGALGQILGGVGNIGGGILEGVGRATVGKLLPQPVIVMNWPPGFGAGTDIIAGGGMTKGLISKIISLLPAVFLGGLIVEAGLLLGGELNKFFGVDKNTPRTGETVLQLPGGVTLNYGGMNGRGPVPIPVERPAAPPIANQTRDRDPSRPPVKPISEQIRDATAVAAGVASALDAHDRDRGGALEPKLESVADQVRDSKSAIETGTSAARVNAERFRGAVSDGANRTVSAIRGIRPPTVITTVKVNVTAGQVSQSIFNQTLYGPPNGSGGGGGGNNIPL